MASPTRVLPPLLKLTSLVRVRPKNVHFIQGFYMNPEPQITKGERSRVNGWVGVQGGARGSAPHMAGAPACPSLMSKVVPSRWGLTPACPKWWRRENPSSTRDVLEYWVPPPPMHPSARPSQVPMWPPSKGGWRGQQLSSTHGGHGTLKEPLGDE